MAKAEQVITEGAQAFLEEDEEVLSGLVVAPRGNTQAIAGGLGIGAGKVADNVAAGGQAGFRLESPMALALTNRRLLSLAYANPVGMGIGGKVKDLLDAVPIAEVDAIEVKRLLAGYRITLRIRGVEFKLEAGAGAKAKPLAEAFAGLKTRA